MSVITKQGDSGTTGLMYGRRVPKTHPRIAANGVLDELNAILGLVRWHARADHASSIEKRLHDLQSQLILLMGDIATDTSDRERYQRDGFQILDETVVTRLTSEAKTLESKLNARFTDWAIPGSAGPLTAAHLDHARTVCRRAEQSVWEIVEGAEYLQLSAVYLNRLADYLWILARAVERDLA